MKTEAELREYLLALRKRRIVLQEIEGWHATRVNEEELFVLQHRLDANLGDIRTVLWTLGEIDDPEAFVALYELDTEGSIQAKSRAEIRLDVLSLFEQMYYSTGKSYTRATEREIAVLEAALRADGNT